MFFPLYDLNPHRRWPVVTVGLIVVNTLVMLWLATQPPVAQIVTSFSRGFVPARLAQLSTGQVLQIDLGELADERHLPSGTGDLGVLQLPPAPGAVALSVLTSMFLHGGWGHLIGNMWFLWIFGNNVEDRLGHVPFLLFYLLGGLVGAIAHYLTAPASLVPVIGASGAIATLLGAYAVTWPHAKIRTLVTLGLIFLWDVPAMLVLGLWFLAQLAEGYLDVGVGMHGGVAWWAHVGGFVAGAVLMPGLSWLVGLGRSGGRFRDDPPLLDLPISRRGY